MMIYPKPQNLSRSFPASAPPTPTSSDDGETLVGANEADESSENGDSSDVEAEDPATTMRKEAFDAEFEFATNLEEILCLMDKHNIEPFF